MSRESVHKNGPFNTPDARDFFIATINELTVSKKSSQLPTVFTRREKPQKSYQTLINEDSRLPFFQDFLQNDDNDDQGILTWYLFFALYLLRTEFELSNNNVIPLLLTAMQVSCKSCYDRYYNNGYAAECFGIPLSDFNQMEAKFLIDTNYETYIHPETHQLVENALDTFKANPESFTGRNFACFWYTLGLEIRRSEAGIPNALTPFTSTVVYDPLEEFDETDSDDDASYILHHF